MPISFVNILDFIKYGFEVFMLMYAVSVIKALDNKIAVYLISREMLFFDLNNHSEHHGYLPLALKFLDGRYFGWGRRIPIVPQNIYGSHRDFRVILLFFMGSLIHITLLFMILVA